MPSIKMTISTSKSVSDVHRFVDEEILTRPEAEMLMHEHHWEGDVLHASGSLGTGTITLNDGEVVIDIELSMFGVAARSRIEDALRDQFSKIK